MDKPKLVSHNIIFFFFLMNEKFISNYMHYRELKSDPNRHNTSCNPTHLNTRKELRAKQTQQP